MQLAGALCAGRKGRIIHGRQDAAQWFQNHILCLRTLKVSFQTLRETTDLLTHTTCGESYSALLLLWWCFLHRSTVSRPWESQQLMRDLRNWIWWRCFCGCVWDSGYWRWAPLLALVWSINARAPTVNSLFLWFVAQRQWPCPPPTTTHSHQGAHQVGNWWLAIKLQRGQKL